MKAIETRYKGYRFRSRLEARWAVFFDALGIKWEYEPEGIEISDGTRYLPDFELFGASNNQRLFAEVKPLGGCSYKADAVWKETRLRILLLDGVPSPRPYRLIGDYQFNLYFYPHPGRLGRRPDFDKHVEELGGLSRFNEIGMEIWVPTPVKEAIFAARSARFEFGESGARITQ